MSSRKKPVLEDLDDFLYEAGRNLGELASTDPVPPAKKKPAPAPKPAPQALVGGMGQYPATRAK